MFCILFQWTLWNIIYNGFLYLLKEMGAASDDEDDPQYRQIFERKLKAMVELSNLKGKRKKKKVEQIGKDISKIWSEHLEKVHDWDSTMKFFCMIVLIKL